MPIKQETVIDLIECAKAWRAAYKRLAHDIAMVHKIAPAEQKSLIYPLIYSARENLPQDELTSPIDIQDKYYTGRRQENLMRRATMQGLRGEVRAQQETRMRGVMSDEEINRITKGYTPVEDEAPDKAPSSDDGWEALRNAASEPPQPVHTPPHPPGAVRLTLGLGNAPPTVIDPFAGEEDPMTDGEREAMARQGVRGLK